MRLKLFLFMLLSAMLPMTAQTAAIVGKVVDSTSGSPVAGATVSLRDKGLSSQTNFNGDFRLEAPAGNNFITVVNDGFTSLGLDITVGSGKTDLGELRITPVNAEDDYFGESSDLIIDDATFEDEEGSSQSVAALNGANDDIYYSTASYNFSPMYFRYRGYDSQYQTVYINGMAFNDLIRGRFNFSTLMGMTSRAFRNKTTTVGMGASNYGFGSIGGSVNYNTVTDLYSPGFNGSLAYTNSS